MKSETRKFDVQHTLLFQLGEEHLAHAVLRRDTKGDSIVAWGERILQWNLVGDTGMEEVFPSMEGLEYSNGGCAMDVDGDGNEEILVARGGKPTCADPDLLWFKQVSNGKTWVEHQIAHVGGGNWSAPHDILPIIMEMSEGNPLKGVVILMSRQQLIWYEIPDEPTKPWKRHDIGTFPTNNNQSGMVLGDIAGNGRPDIACGMFWAECPADPASQSWQIHRFGKWDDNGWGGMAKLQLGDICRFS